MPPMKTNQSLIIIYNNSQFQQGEFFFTILTKQNKTKEEYFNLSKKQNIKKLDGTYLHEIIDITEEGVSSYINYIDESLPFKNKYGIFAFAFYVYRYKNNKVIKYKKIEF